MTNMFEMAIKKRVKCFMLLYLTKVLTKPSLKVSSKLFVAYTVGLSTCI